MILKWQSLEGNWHVVDGITNVVDHRWKVLAEINKLKENYGGEFLFWWLDPESKAVESDTEKYHYIVATIHGERSHLVIQDNVTYVLSDEGKTIDRF